MLKVLSLFSGIGAFEQALTNLQINYEILNFSEINKNAEKVYCALHNISKDKNLGDITKIDISKLPVDVDLLTYGFPCQDISVMGKQVGFGEADNRTRSGLVYKAFEIINHCKPKFCIMENVKNLLSPKFKKDFNIFLDTLSKIGYNNHYKILKASDFGIPQNRERVFVVSIRSDIKINFTFPIGNKNIEFQDFISCGAPQQYYLKDDQKENLENRFFNYLIKKNYRFPIIIDDYSNAVKTNQTEIGTLTTNIGIKAPRNGTKLVEEINYNTQSLKLRIITPEEAFRLMGFKQEQYLKIKDIVSSAQIYKLARNSIVVNIIEEIYKKLKGNVECF